ncbi:MAG: hypothetical protein ACF8PN_12590 [Phycisphaerales bacterium]
MWLKWLPWRYVLSRVARAQGFIDPVALLSRLHRFAQPSEVAEPIELLRAGVVFHARGLINTRAIQHNLDWVWPFWIERQFDPRDEAFVPRAFSVTHINLTHRNWTAVGLPDCDWLPIVDPAGLLTPVLDGWSLDAWIVPDEGTPLFPSRTKRIDQTLGLDDGVEVRTKIEEGGARLRTTAAVRWTGDGPVLDWNVRGKAARDGWLVVSVRPVNPEGVSFIHDIHWDEARASFRVNDSATVKLRPAPERVRLSEYDYGDVRLHLFDDEERRSISCHVGLATAAAMYRLTAGQPLEIDARTPLAEVNSDDRDTRAAVVRCREQSASFADALHGSCAIDIPDTHMRFLFDAAARNLILHSPHDVYPGPYTYKRFWFRDAAYILDALLSLGLFDRVERCLDAFPSRQTTLGYFLSQEGEWDSNGEAIWIIDRFRRRSGRKLSKSLVGAVQRGASWIRHKRLSDDLDAPHAGLMPAGFSAEHLGPNDFYYWDDFWSIAGLNAAASILDEYGAPEAAAKARVESDRLTAAVERSLNRTTTTRDRSGIPASPYRRMDAGAIGSIVVGYPLELGPSDDPRLLQTIEFLLENCMVAGGFFQDMIHSGVNAYLTLHMAQVLMRAGDARHFKLTRAVADLASPTGQWPEAIHPRTRGGCMGDGQHMWAAAEWVLMMRNMFVREEGDRLLFGSGLPDEWLTPGTRMSFGPAPTDFGPVTLRVEVEETGVRFDWDAEWRDRPREIVLGPTGRRPLAVAASNASGVWPHQSHGQSSAPVNAEAST